MVRHVEVYLSDEEYSTLVKMKGKQSWKEFILELTKTQDKTVYLLQKVSELYGYLSIESEVDKEILKTIKELTIAYLNKNYAEALKNIAKLEHLTTQYLTQQQEKQHDKEIEDIVKGELEA